MNKGATLPNPDQEIRFVNEMTMDEVSVTGEAKVAGLG
jgi:hypothetical protein